MKLFYAPGTCSMAIHLLLEELGQPFDTQRIVFANGDQKTPDYLAVNPKGKVPALLTDNDGVVTEMPAICFYLGLRFPDAGLLPADAMQQVRTLELLDFVAATVHMRGFSRLSNPAAFSPDGDPELVRTEGRRVVVDGLRVLDADLGDKPYALGAQFTVADAGLFILEWWAGKRDVPLPTKLAAHFERLLERPAIQRMLETEGLQR